MKATEEIETKYLQDCLYVDGDGDLIWKERPSDHFSSVRSMRSWNAKHAGKKAGCNVKKKDRPNDYKQHQVKINYVTCMYHIIKEKLLELI
jgi:hypothetical protein